MLKKTITLLLSLILTMQLIGCNSKESNNESNGLPADNYSVEEKEAINTIDEIINAVQNADIAFIEQFRSEHGAKNSIDESIEIIELLKLLKPIAENVTYKYISTEKLDDNSVNVLIEFTMPNPENLKDSEYATKLRQSIILVFLGEDLENIFQENENEYKNFLKSNPETIKKEVSCLVKKDENSQWNLDDDSLTVILDNITGNILTILDAMEE